MGQILNVIAERMKLIGAVAEAAGFAFDVQPIPLARYCECCVGRFGIRKDDDAEGYFIDLPADPGRGAKEPRSWRLMGDPIARQFVRDDEHIFLFLLEVTTQTGDIAWFYNPDPDKFERGSPYTSAGTLDTQLAEALRGRLN